MPLHKTRCCTYLVVLSLTCIIPIALYSVNFNDQLVFLGRGFQEQQPGGVTESAPKKTSTLTTRANATKEDGDRSLEAAARAIYAKRGVVAMAVINNNYLSMAASWLCNTAGMAGVHESVLLLTTDTPTALRLRAIFPRLTVVSLNTSDYDGGQQFGRKGYVRLMVQRTRLLLRLLRAGVRLLLFEVDCLWLSDPLPALLAKISHNDGADIDIIACVISNRGGKTAGGFLLMNPSAATLQLWSNLTRQMDQLYEEKLKNTKDSAKISYALNEQTVLIRLIRERHAGVKVHHLPIELYQDGVWYDSHKPNRPLQHPRPIIINNNFLIGKNLKIGRAKAYGHWFWNEKAESCDVTAVKKLFQGAGDWSQSH